MVLLTVPDTRLILSQVFAPQGLDRNIVSRLGCASQFHNFPSFSDSFFSLHRAFHTDSKGFVRKATFTEYLVKVLNRFLFSWFLLLISHALEYSRGSLVCKPLEASHQLRGCPLRRKRAGYGRVGNMNRGRVNTLVR